MSRQFIAFPDFKLKALTFSYDDGVVQDMRLVDIFNRNGLKATFNINSSRFVSGERNPRFLTEKQAKELYIPNGHEIAVHGYMHRSLTNVEKSVMYGDIVIDRFNLERIFGGIINGMAYANGAYNHDISAKLNDMGITYARTCVSTNRFDLPSNWLELSATCHHSNPELMSLAKAFVDNTPWLSKDSAALFYVWGHSYEFDNNDNWNVIEQFAEYIGNKEDIWYATNGEICRYIKAYDDLVFSVDGNTVYNPSAIDVYLKCYYNNYVVPAGKTINIDLR